MFLLLLLTLSVASAQDLQCYVQGECSGFFNGITIEDGYNDCLQTCKDISDCNWITYFANSKECFKYATCNGIESGCPECHSGQKECELETLTCGVHGLCEGNIVAHNTTASESECLNLCQQFEDCNWYTYFPQGKSCILTEECAFLDESCTDCISGQRQCFEESAFGQLLIIGGELTQFQVEVVDLTDSNKTCPQLQRSPHTGFGAVGTFIDGKAVICGGRSSATTNTCFSYLPDTDEWNETISLVVEREFMADVRLSETEWWITGGSDAGFNPLSSTEVYNGLEFLTYIDLPQVARGHNMVKINSTHFMLVSGASAKAWMFDRTVEEWNPLPGLMQSRGDLAHAGLVTYPDGRQAVVVTGGYGVKSTEIYNLTEGFWQTGPDLPIESYLEGGSSVQYGDSFLIVGGLKDGLYSELIYSFDPISEDWIELPQKLTTARGWFTAILVPTNFIDCSKQH